MTALIPPLVVLVLILTLHIIGTEKKFLWAVLFPMLFIFSIFFVPVKMKEQILTPDYVFRNKECIVAVVGNETFMTTDSKIVNSKPFINDIRVKRTTPHTGIGIPVLSSRENGIIIVENAGNKAIIEFIAGLPHVFTLPEGLQNDSFSR